MCNDVIFLMSQLSRSLCSARTQMEKQTWLHLKKSDYCRKLFITDYFFISDYFCYIRLFLYQIIFYIRLLFGRLLFITDYFNYRVLFLDYFLLSLLFISDYLLSDYFSLDYLLFQITFYYRIIFTIRLVFRRIKCDVSEFFLQSLNKLQWIDCISLKPISFIDTDKQQYNHQYNLCV